MRRSACYLGILALSVTGIDLVATALCRSTGLADRRVDIHHPATLMVKLDRLRAAPGPKVVLLGDSLVHGGILERFGDPDWRQHGLGERLAAELSDRPGYEPFVMNLGMDGLLPADLECLAPLVAACGVDWIVLDVHLRPFSTDFSPPDRQMSRPWLRDLSADAAGRVRWRPADGATEWSAGRLADWSALVRNRAMVQEYALSIGIARPPILRPAPATTDTDAEIQSLVKLAQLKKRLAALDLGPEGPQAAALPHPRRPRDAGPAARRLLREGKPGASGGRHGPGRHAERYERLVRLVRDAQGPDGVFVPPVADLRADHFLDFTHLNAEGYKLLARRLASEIE